MCIAIYIPAGKDIKDEQIKNAFSNNKDGAGVMHYDKNGQVHYAKGFMDVESLINYWRHSTSDKYPRAIHCRIATSGKISKGCCHPFPITDNLDDMLVPHGVSEHGCLIHNGVFSNYTPKEGMKSLYSDTMFFTQKVIYPMHDLLNNSGVEELLSNITSKVLVFLPNYEVHRYGTWEYEKEQGFYASNGTYDYDNSWWKDYKYKSYGNTTWSNYLPPTTVDKGGDVATTNSWEDDYVDDATDCYEIVFKAPNYSEAESKAYKFIDRFYKSITEYGLDYVIDTLEPFGSDDEWCFIAEAKEDITDDILKEGFDILYHYDNYGNEICEIGGE